MAPRIDIVCADNIVGKNGELVPVDPKLCLQKAPESPIALPTDKVITSFATSTTNALGNSITKMMEGLSDVPKSLVTYHKIKFGAIGAAIDYEITYEEIAQEYGGGLKANIVTGGILLESLVFASGISALAVQTAIGASLFAAAPIVTGFAVAVGAGVLVTALFDTEIYGVSIGNEFEKMFAGAYDAVEDLFRETTDWLGTETNEPVISEWPDFDELDAQYIDETGTKDFSIHKKVAKDALEKIGGTIDTNDVLPTQQGGEDYILVKSGAITNIDNKNYLINDVLDSLGEAVTEVATFMSNQVKSGIEWFTKNDSAIQMDVANWLAAILPKIQSSSGLRPPPQPTYS